MAFASFSLMYFGIQVDLTKHPDEFVMGTMWEAKLVFKTYSYSRNGLPYSKS